MNEILETKWEENGKEYRLRIYQDEDPPSPREWDNISRLVFWDRRSYLSAPDENQDESCTPELWLEDLPEGAVYLPVYKYEHGGVCYQTASFSCPWDSGQIGFVYTTPEILKGMGHEDPSKLDENKIKSWLSTDVDTFSQWASGDVYGFTVESRPLTPCSECERPHDWENENSCWGFYGQEWKDNGITDHLGEDWTKRLLAA